MNSHTTGRSTAAVRVAAPRPLMAQLSALILLLLSAWNLYGLFEHQQQSAREARLQEAVGQLRTVLLQGGLPQQAVSDLVDAPGSRLSFLALRDAQGQPVASAGRYENLHLPGLSGDALAGLRARLYALGSTTGNVPLQAPSGRALGSLDYTLSAGLPAWPQEPAAHSLLLSSLCGLLLAAALLAWAFSLQQPLSPVAPQLLDRLATPVRGADGHPSATAPSAEVEQQIAQALRLRVGAALDQLHYGLILADRQGNLGYMNRLAESLTGWPLADARQRLVYSVFHPIDEQGKPLVNAAEESLQQGHPVVARECRLRARSGGITSVEMMAALLHNAEGNVDGVALLFRDMSVSLRRLDESRRQMRISQGVIDHLEEGLLTTDPSGVVRSANMRAQRMFGYTREEMEGVTVTKLMPVPFLNTPSIKLLDYSGARSGIKLPKVVGWRKDATTFPAELQVQGMSVGDDSGLIVIVRDISERLRSENLASRLGRLLDSAVEEVYIFDAQSLYFLEVNRGARRNLGYRQEQLSRMTPLAISTQIDETVFLSDLARLRGGEVEHLSYRCSHKRSDGSEYPVEVRLNYSRDEEPPVFMAIAADISERLVVEEKLRHLAQHDALTGLPTRAVLHDRLRQTLLVAARSNLMVAVYFVDIDLFKQINDGHGHETGDAVLRAFSERLKSLLRAADTVARLAGDEFVVIAAGLRSVEDADLLGRKIVDSFRRRLDIPGQDLTVTVSVGAAVYPLDDSDAEALLRHADSAMYAAKQAGRNGYRLFNADIDPERRRRLDLEREIHAAVALNQYRLVLDPVIDDSGAVRAALVSVSWEHPRHGRIGAAETLRAATRAGLLADLELWLVCNCCAQLQGDSRPALPLVVGISGWQMRDADFSEHLLHLIDRFQVPPRRLILALSQEGLAEAATAPAERLARLSQRGVRFALRDFGVGLDLPDRQATPGIDLLLLPEEMAGRLRSGPAGAGPLRGLLQSCSASGHQVIVTGIGDDGLRNEVRHAGALLMAGIACGEDLATPAGAAWLARQRSLPL